MSLMCSESRRRSVRAAHARVAALRARGGCAHTGRRSPRSALSASFGSPRISSTGRASSAGASRQLTKALPRSSCTIRPMRRRSASGIGCGPDFVFRRLSSWIMYCLSVQRRHYPTLRVAARRGAVPRGPSRNFCARAVSVLARTYFGRARDPAQLFISAMVPSSAQAQASAKRHPVHLDDFACSWALVAAVRPLAM